MPVSVQKTIEQGLEHLHPHRTNVEENSSLELAVKKIANNKKYIGTKTQKFEAIKKVGDKMVIDAYATVMNAVWEENKANNKNSLVKLPPQELSQLYLQGGGYLPGDPANHTCPFCSHSYVYEPEENKRLVAKNRVAAAKYKLKLRVYKANGNCINTEGQNRNQKHFNVIVSRYLAPVAKGMDLVFLGGADAILDADKENIDIGKANAGKAIASILAMSALEAHNFQVAVVAARNGVSDPSAQQFQETLYFQGATQNLIKDLTINLSSLREYAGTAPNIALPGGEVYDTWLLGKENGGFRQRNNRLEESTVASSSNGQGSLPMGPLVATISLRRTAWWKKQAGGTLGAYGKEMGAPKWNSVEPGGTLERSYVEMGTNCNHLGAKGLPRDISYCAGRLEEPGGTLDGSYVEMGTNRNHVGAKGL
eukprot:jgi/Psemu1/21507/gm1.21507_g